MNKCGKDTIAHLHYNLATTYNALFSIEHDPHLNGRAIKHFNAALTYLRDPELRTRLQVNLGNALAYASRYRKSPFLSPIQVDKSSLLESFGKYKLTHWKICEIAHPTISMRLSILLKLTSTLPQIPNTLIARIILRAASECVEAMKRIPQTSLGIDHHLLGIVTESRLVLTGGFE